jgi:hypothetical protein
MGELKRVVIDHGKMTVLMLYEQSVELANVPAKIPTLRARIVGNAMDIRCTYPGCGHSRDWNVGEDGMKRLLEAVRHMHDNAEENELIIQK